MVDYQRYTPMQQFTWERNTIRAGGGIPFLDRFFEYNIIAEHLKQVKGWQSKNPLMMIYRALAEWKNGKSKVASETLSGIKGKSWESKVNAIQEIIRDGS